jgi:hypothetical protein
MNIIKRLLNVVLIILVTAYLVIVGLLLGVSYDSMRECKVHRAIDELCANPRIQDCANSDEFKNLQRRYQSQYEIWPLDALPYLSLPKCSQDSHEFWLDNLFRYFGLYSVLLVIGLLLLLTVNYVFLGSLTLWHKVRPRE